MHPNRLKVFVVVTMVLVTVDENAVVTLVKVDTGVRKLLMTFVAMASNDVLIVLTGARIAPLAREYVTCSSNEESMDDAGDGCSKPLRNWTACVGSTLRNHCQKYALLKLFETKYISWKLRINWRGLELLVHIGSRFRAIGNQNGDVEPKLTLATAGSKWVGGKSTANCLH